MNYLVGSDAPLHGNRFEQDHGKVLIRNMSNFGK